MRPSKDDEMPPNPARFRPARLLLLPALIGLLALAATACTTTGPSHPPVSQGTAELRLRPTSTQPATDAEKGAFRVVCDLARVAPDDPIVFPGQPGKAHLHLFWGNTGIDASSTNASLHESGRSTCAGGIANRSGYWIPAMVDTATNQALAPTFAIIYYKSGYGGIDPATITTPPAGLRMIAGDAMDGTQGESEASYFGCANRYIGHVQQIPTECDAGDDISVTVNFPQCWDGRNLDSVDHKRHLAFTTATRNRGCPASHPVALPRISINVTFDVTPSSDVSKWRLSSDMYGTDQPAGRSLHGDWMNGWNPDILDKLVKHCINRAVDCHGAMLGDGTELG
jgi:hypothetical protein